MHRARALYSDSTIARLRGDKCHFPQSDLSGRPQPSRVSAAVSVLSEVSAGRRSVLVVAVRKETEKTGDERNPHDGWKRRHGVFESGAGAPHSKLRTDALW